MRAVLPSRRLFSVLLLGFASGLPLALTGATLQAWMKSSGVDIRTIGLYSLVGFPYVLKFFWSPVMDRFTPKILGRRRGWILYCQIALVVTIGAMAFLNPAKMPGVTALLALLVAFAGASQDIVIDAYRTDLLEPDERGPGAALHITGYRIAMIVSGSLSLILADHLSWHIVYLLMAAVMGIGIFANLTAPEPRVHVTPPKDLRSAIILPFMEFFKRTGAVEILFFVVIYKLGAVMGVALTTPFMLDMGFTLTDIGVVSKGVGMVCSIVGSLLGGIWMVRLGNLKSLWIFGVVQTFSNLGFMLLAHVGHHYSIMAASIGVENLCSGMGNAAFFAFLMTLCDRRFTATQFALLSSLFSLGRVVAGAPTGFLVHAFGWEQYFVISTLMGAPGLLLLMRYKKWKVEPAQ